MPLNLGSLQYIAASVHAVQLSFFAPTSESSIKRLQKTNLTIKTKNTAVVCDFV